MFQAVGLTLLCAGVIATCLCYRGETLDQLLGSSSFRFHWSVAFIVTAALLVYVGGLAAVTGSTQLVPTLTVYRKVMVFVLIAVFLLIALFLTRTS
ncbi:hypothetical protein LCGC14_1180250 [marine sediment metagenome]|uniref:Uncharacterized protein n=1 Tax=marine sediment metagenome TaxID=412755 RepID=A0A0F9P594_9ZZZZ